MYNREYTPERISELRYNEVFVFGSNLAGSHGGGAARLAHNRFGAVWGQGVGLQGQSYAIPTMQGGVETIKPYVDDFIRFAQSRPDLKFYVTQIGCGIAGFKAEEIAPLFDKAFDMGNIILPKAFVEVINHARQLSSETSGMGVYACPIEFFPEDIKKMEGMSPEEKIEYMIILRKNEKYKIGHDSPEASYFSPVLNGTDKGNHVIAITDNTFAIAAGSKLYSNRLSWGLNLGQNIVSVIPMDNCAKNFPYGQFAVLIEDGSVKEIWSESCIMNLSEEKCYIAIASGCGGCVFALRQNGTVDVLLKNEDSTYLEDVKSWTGIRQIDAGPRHVVGLKNDGTVVAAGKSSACKPLSEWKNIEKIYVSKASSLYGKENDLTFGIDSFGWLHIDGDLWQKGEEFWKRIRAQYDVTDVIENGYAVWVRLQDGLIRCITYYGKMNYLEEINFVEKYKDELRYMNSYGNLTVLIDKDGEFRVLNNSSPIFNEVKWWSHNLDEECSIT